jgi:tetratricopeptide (TPR) repeat protein
VAFLSPDQRYSAKARAELEQMLGQLGEQGKDLDVVASTADPNAFRGMLRGETQFAGRVVRTVDKDYTLWGKFGAIAIPTVVICGRDGKVLWLEAGYSYDFAPTVKARLNQALGIAQALSPDSAGVVTPMAKDTVEAQIRRLEQAADLMSGKGHLESAVAELDKARQLDPNAVDVLVRLAELYCKNGKGLDAVRVLENREGRNLAERARLGLVLGWAHRQAGNTAQAEQSLLQSVELDPRSARAFFELGRVYETQSRTDKAVDAYRRALGLLFGER